MIDGKMLISWGFKPGRHFKEMLREANYMHEAGATEQQISARLQELVPVEIAMRPEGIGYGVFLDVENDLEQENLDAVRRHMDALMRVPTIKAGVVMPDACPAGSALGTIPVGGVVATEDAIHPGFHSADICCSVAISVFKNFDDPKHVLDVAQKITHFGPGKRQHSAARNSKELGSLIGNFETNRFLCGLEGCADYHFMTQGDGNHFLFVGRSETTGQLAIVTHHGSRSLGAQLYKRGMAAAQRYTRAVARDVPKHNAWIAADTQEGEDYWHALQMVRKWTKMNHFAIHDGIARALGNKVDGRFWNEHNFVFRKPNGMFYHGKGATPNWRGYAADDSGFSLIPLNMAEPILVASHVNNKHSLGFAPHGAGRNMSRTRYLREHEPTMPDDIDVRFWCGKPDHSELPGAYKNAASVTTQIEKYGLAEIEDRIQPFGSIMAGDWEADAPWRKNRK